MYRYIKSNNISHILFYCIYIQKNNIINRINIQISDNCIINNINSLLKYVLYIINIK